MSMTPIEIRDHLTRLRKVSWTVGLVMGGIIGLFGSTVYAGFANVESTHILATLVAGTCMGIMTTGIILTYIENKAISRDLLE